MSYNRVIFEYPTGWIDSNSDSLAHQHIRCLETLKAAAEELQFEFNTIKSIRMGDFAQRYASNETLLISVHSVGVANNVVRLKESYLPGLYYFDRTGYSGWAELAYNRDLQNQACRYDLSNGIEFVEKIKHEKLKNNSSKYGQPSRNNTSTQLLDNTPYVLLALQTSEDLVASLATVNQLLLAEALAKKISDFNLTLVIKRHPLCKDNNVGSTIDRLKKRYGCVRISENSINDLIIDAKAVVTVNSGVGFETLIMGVPLITAGRSDYSFVTKSICNIGDLCDLNSMLVEIDRTTICSVIKFYIEQYCLACGDTEKAKNLLLKWQSEDYSMMHNLHGYNESVLQDAQIYVANAENTRRDNLLHSPKTLPEFRFNELFEEVCCRIKNKIFGVL